MCIDVNHKIHMHLHWKHIFAMNNGNKYSAEYFSKITFLGPSVPSFRLLTEWQSGRGLYLCVSMPIMHSCVLQVYILCIHQVTKENWSQTWQVISLCVYLFSVYENVAVWNNSPWVTCTLSMCWQVKVKSYMLGTHSIGTYSHCKNKPVVSTTQWLP